MKKGTRIIGSVISWCFVVLCLMFLLVYGIKLGTVLLLALGIVALPIKPMRELWNKIPLKKNWIKPVLISILFVFAVGILPSNDTSTLDSNQSTEITAGNTSTASQNNEVNDPVDILPTKEPEIATDATLTEVPKITATPIPTLVPTATEPPVLTKVPSATPAPELLQMPSVLGLSINEAKALLNGVSTSFTIIYEEDYSDEILPGIIIKQYPNNSASVNKTMTITLTVSAGPANTKVPNVYNLSLTEAQETMLSKGYSTKIEYQNSTTVTKGCIISTSPARFDLVAKDSIIVLYVSSGAADTSTPSPVPTETPKITATPTPIISQASIGSIPKYSGTSYSIINNNKPYFESKDLTTESFEYYSDLDSLGRCGVTLACVGKDIMPTEDRGSIGQVKPTGWQTIKYDIVDGKYLYNRCHLIGFQLTGENANVRNLITGTRSMNVDGMLPFENMVADYVKESGNHVMYRVTPLYEGNNLLATGVLMEAQSVEDYGDGILFNVFVYNVQPGIVIDYLTGNSQLTETPVVTATPTPSPIPQITQTPDTDTTSYVWIPASGKKYHSINNCGTMNPNKATRLTKDEALMRGYAACSKCN